MEKPVLKQAPEAIVLGLVAGLLCIYLLLLWKWERNVIELVYAATAVGLVSVLFSKVALWVATAWMGLGQLMGKVVGTVLLSVVFILLLTPLARLQALFSKSDKFKGTGTGADSAWIDRKHKFETKDLEELW